MNQDAWPFIAQMIAYFAVAHGISLGFGKILSSYPQPFIQLIAKRIEASAYFTLAFCSLAIVNTWNVETAVMTDRGLLLMEWAPTVVKATVLYLCAFVGSLLIQAWIPIWARSTAYAFENDKLKWFLTLLGSMVSTAVLAPGVLLGAAGVADYFSWGWWISTALCSIVFILAMLIRAACIDTTTNEVMSADSREPRVCQVEALSVATPVTSEQQAPQPDIKSQVRGRRVRGRIRS
ncbi:hypothetical protein ACLXNF_12325 [Mycobacteroides chelonae]|uniref:hypothetical protein n=1 Tax=Mycobacteroides chelonae TaxID=1774 RepID=UPI0039E8C6CB